MKKAYAFVISVILCICFSMNAFAAEFYYDNEWHKYEGNIFNLRVNSELLNTEMPPVVFDGYSLVPARDVFEALGADVSWNADSQTVKIADGGNVVKISIDKSIGYVNSEAVSLQLAPKLINGKTMIPVRFVGESLGYMVDFDSSTDSVIINSKAYEAEQAPTLPPAPEPTAAPEASPVAVSGVSWELLADKGLVVVTIKTDTQNPRFSTFELSDTPRVVMDIENAGFTSEMSAMHVMHGNFQTMRFGNNNGNARIVADNIVNLGYNAYCSGSSIILEINVDLNIARDPLEMISFSKSGNKDIFETSFKVNSISVDKNSCIVTVSDPYIPQKTAQMNLSGNFCSSLEYAPVDSQTARYILRCNTDEIAVSKNADTVTIRPMYVDLPRRVTIDAGHGGDDPGAIFKDEAGNIIAKEKDINLGIALKVRDILESENVEVHMIRTTDVYVDFKQVGSIANAQNSSLFVSVHTNSVEGVPTAHGIETWGYLDSGTVSNTMTGKLLSQYVLDNVISQTGAYSRGVKDGKSLAVIRTTAMPATLVEVGFITNEEERNNMLISEYQQKLAKGIADGILQALDKMRIY